MSVDLARAPLPMAPPGDSPPSDQYLLNFRDAMFDRYRDRNDDFQTLVEAWHGSLYAHSSRSWNMDSAGRPILRTWDRAMTDQPAPHNIYKGFVDAYKRALVMLPDARIPKSHGMTGTDLAGQKEAEKWAERMRRAAYGFWAASDMDINQIDAAWWLTVCGSHGLVLMPDFDRGIARMHYVPPWDVYGVGKLGDPIGLSRVIISSEEDPLVVGSEYPDETAGSANYRARTDLSPTGTSSTGDTTDSALRSVRHSIYLDENWFVRMVGDRVVARDYHGLKFCPALIPPLLRLPKYVNRGHSVAEQALPMQHSIDFGVNLWEAGMKDALFKTAWVKDPINVPDNWARGKGMLITLTAEGEVGEFGGDPQALKMVREHFDMQRTMMEINTGVSRPALTGQLAGGGPTTGRGMEKAQGPYLAAVEEIQTTQSIYMSRALLMAFAMTANAEFWDDTEDGEVTFEGFVKKQNVYEKFTRKELRDVKAVEIVFAPMAHLGLHERVNIALQLYNTKPPLLSWQRIIELTGLVDDVEELRSQIESDNAWRMQIMREEAAAQTPQQPGDGGGGDPAQADASREAGATNTDTLRRAGAMGQPPAPPGAPGEEVPAAGAPAGPGGPSGAAGMTDAQVLDPQKLAQVFKEPPADPAARKSGIGSKPDDLESTVRAELQGIKLKGDAWLKGHTLFVDFRDKFNVKNALGHHSEIKIQTIPKGVEPKDAQRVGNASEEASRATKRGPEEGHPGAGAQQPAQAKGKTPLA